MMIEAVPFFHILINTIEGEIGDDVSDPADYYHPTDRDRQPSSIIATTMVAFAISSVLTGTY